MARILKCAIDSRPLSSHAFSTYDYSGSQVHGLMTTPLSYFLRSTPAGPDDDGSLARIRISTGRAWSDGVPVTASQYLAGIRKVAGANAFVGRYLLRKVKSIRVAKDILEFEMHRPNYRLREVLAIPNFVPFREESRVSSGEFAIEDQSEDRFDFRSKDGDQIQVLVVKAPEDNLKLYRDGRLDLTSDTAFPYYRYAEYQSSREFNLRESGLYTALVFGLRLRQENGLLARRFIQQAVESCDFTAVTFGVCPPIGNLHGGPASLTEAPASRVALRNLRLAYDDFYPNREICEVIAGRLEELGVTTILVQDDYYYPTVDFDLKLSILRGLGNTPYLRYAGALLGGVLSHLPETRTRYAVLLDSLESTQSHGEQQALYEALSLILRETVALVPLFRVPSTYLSKLEDGRNPLIPNSGVA